MRIGTNAKLPLATILPVIRSQQRQSAESTDGIIDGHFG
jgi:hypothetical protein